MPIATAMLATLWLVLRAAPSGAATPTPAPPDAGAAPAEKKGVLTVEVRTLDHAAVADARVQLILPCGPKRIEVPLCACPIGHAGAFEAESTPAGKRRIKPRLGSEGTARAAMPEGDSADPLDEPQVGEVSSLNPLCASCPSSVAALFDLADRAIEPIAEREVRTDHDGLAVFRDLSRQQPYTVCVEGPSIAALCDTSHALCTQGTFAGDEDDAPQAFGVAPRAWLRIRVTDRSGHAIREAKVAAFHGSDLHAYRLQRVGPNFELAGPSVFANEDVSLLAAAPGYLPLIEEGVRVENDEAPHAIKLQRAVTLRGNVARGGRPVPHASVMLILEAEDFRITTTSDAHGQFSISPLSAGHYRIEAYDAAGLGVRAISVKEGQVGEVTIDLRRR
jgi:hypothetical protein